MWGGCFISVVGGEVVSSDSGDRSCERWKSQTRFKHTETQTLAGPGLPDRMGDHTLPPPDQPGNYLHNVHNHQTQWVHELFLSETQWNAGVNYFFISSWNEGHSAVDAHLLDNWTVRLCKKGKRNLLYCFFCNFPVSSLIINLTYFEKPCNSEKTCQLLFIYLNTSFDDINLDIVYIRLGSIQTGVSCPKIDLFAKNSLVWNKLTLS